MRHSTILTGLLVVGAAPAAWAGTGIDIRMGGDAVFEAAAVDQDRDANRRSVVFADRVRLNTVATAKTDSGLSYGMRLRIRSVAGNGGSNTVNADRAYVFVSGSFGQFKLGTNDGYNDDIVAPQNAWPLGWQTSYLNLNAQGVLHAAGGNGTAISAAMVSDTLLDNRNASKIIYATPKLSGFQLGVSYTPNSQSSGYTVVRADNANDGYHDIWEVGGNYTGKVGGVSLFFSTGFMAGERNDDGAAAAAAREDLTAFQAAGQIGYAGWTAGGGYINRGKTDQRVNSTGKRDFEVIGAAVQYEAGAGTYGGSYTHGQTQGLEQDTWALGLLYTVAPGLLMGAEYNYIDADATGTASDDKANVFMVRSVVLF